MNRPSTIWYYQSIVYRVQEYMEAHLHEDISLQRMSDHTCVSYHHLADIFAQTENESLGGYIKRYRLEKAASLLWYTDLSLTSIAEKTGYTSSPSLSKAFAQHFHSSPGAFRRKLRFLKHSPNAILDGIQTEESYQAILNKEFDFQYRIEKLNNYYTVCQPLKMVPAYSQQPFQYDTYLETVYIDMDHKLPGRRVIKPFDSLNFCPANRFTMHHGKLINGTVYAQLSAAVRKTYLVSPVKNGQYLIFTIPPGQADEQIKNYTTLFRENLIGNKKIFRPEDFFIFLVLSEDESKTGEFYMYLSG
ncbi:MAG TPA: AraC family transcriptional regulator [Niastella sp.]